MKRYFGILAALILTIAVSIQILVLMASPAQAVTCGESQSKNNQKWWGAGPPGSVLVTATVYFKNCDNNTKKRIVAYQVDVTGGGVCGAYDEYDVDPDSIATWNPGLKDQSCSSNYALDWTFPAGEYVYPSDPASQRCIGGDGYIQYQEQLGGSDPSTSLPVNCFY